MYDVEVQVFFGVNVGSLTEEYGQRKELAKVAGITEQQVQNILNGTLKKGVGLKAAWLMARHLGVTLDELCLPPKKFQAIRKRVLAERD